MTPKKGTKEKLVELAYKNAQMVLLQDTEKIKREEQRTTGAMKEIADWLGLGYLRRADLMIIRVCVKYLQGVS